MNMLVWTPGHVVVCYTNVFLGSFHTRDWEPMTITLQALSLVEKVEPVQVLSTLRLRDQRSMWMQDGCKVYVNSYMVSNGSCVHGHLNYSRKPPLGDMLNTKPGDHDTPNAHNRWFILFCHVWGPAWIVIHRDSIWFRARSHMTSHYTPRSVTTLRDSGGDLGWPLDTFFWALKIS